VSLKEQSMRASLLIACLVSTALLGAARAEEDDDAEYVLENFDALPLGPYQKGFLDSWRWTPAEREAKSALSRIEIVTTPVKEGRSLRVKIDDESIVAGEPIPVLRLARHLTPDTDAIAFRVQVVSGRMSLYVGGPTAYYGNSDVYTEPKTLLPQDPPQWIEVWCDLNDRTWRNFRRAGLSTDAPRNYYTRWAQEPLGVFLGAGSHGELLIDRIDTITYGEGRPFPEYDPQITRRVRTIADFEPAAQANGTSGAKSPDFERAFNLYMAADEVEWFEESWRRTKPLRFAPLKLSLVDEGFDGKTSLACTGRTAEEVQCTGVRTTGEAGANAIVATVRSTAREDRSTLEGLGPALPLDFFVFVAPPGKPFRWSRFGPSAELQAHGGPGFDYNFSHRSLRSVTDSDFAIYQTRRFVKPGDWSRLVLPAADFTCVYGHGTYRRKLLDHEPLAFDDCIAVAWLTPWCRVGRRTDADTTLIDELSFVAIDRTPDELRSYWKVPDVKQLLTRDGELAGRKTRHFSLPKEKPVE